MKLGIVLSSILVALLLCLMFWPKPEADPEPEPERVTALVEPTNIVTAPSGSVKVSVTPDISEPEAIEIPAQANSIQGEEMVPFSEPEPEPEAEPVQDPVQEEPEGEEMIPLSEPELEPIEEPIQEPEGMTDLGCWTITAYCGCYSCCGDWSGSPTASGAWPQSWHTVAADWLPFGSRIYIEGLGEFVVEDRGVYGDWIDVYFDAHDEADSFGMQYREVYLIE